jgi:hypothetical protein
MKLENPNLTARIADIVGRPIDRIIGALPKHWKENVNKITQAALYQGLNVAINTLGKDDGGVPKNIHHKAGVIFTGVVGGFFGFMALAVELPLSTSIILRSIADIARCQGHDLSLLETRLSCLEVLALGGKSDKDDAAENGYWIVRTALSRAVSDATTHIMNKGLVSEGAPPVARLIIAIASRFSVTVAEEAAAKMVPVVGAAAGGTINYLFMCHYQDMAFAHFTIKRLEKKYSTEIVRKAYESIPA